MAAHLLQSGVWCGCAAVSIPLCAAMVSHVVICNSSSVLTWLLLYAVNHHTVRGKRHVRYLLLLHPAMLLANAAECLCLQAAALLLGRALQ